jgi:hypothetical protein
MNDDQKREIGKSVLDSESKRKIVANEEFAEVRQWYHSLPIEKRQRFKQDVQAFVEITERLRLNWHLFTKAGWSPEQYDDEGKLILSIFAEQEPKSWLEAIELWDETENLSLSPPDVM